MTVRSMLTLTLLRLDKAIFNVLAMLGGQNKHLRNNGDAAQGDF